MFNSVSNSHGHHLTSIDRHIFLYVSIMESWGITTFKLARESSQTPNYPEKSHRRSAIERAVSDFCLCRQVVRILNRRYHPLNSQEGSEICCVALERKRFHKKEENVYEITAPTYLEMIISVKNHQIPPTMRVLVA